MPFAIFGPRPAAPDRGRRLHAVPDRQRRHRELRLLLLPGGRARRVPARRRRRRTRAGPPRARRARARRALCRSAARRASPPQLPRRRCAPSRPRARRGLAIAGADAFVSSRRRARFTSAPARRCARDPVLERDWTAHLVNTYHLFASITRERIEPEFQTLADGPPRPSADDAAWTAHTSAQAGRLTRAPDFVAPHQPRVDFRLWFYGLCSSAARPLYVIDAARAPVRASPQAVQPLFRAPLPPHRPPCASSTGSTSSPAPPRRAPPAPGGVGRASRPCVRYPAHRFHDDQPAGPVRPAPDAHGLDRHAVPDGVHRPARLRPGDPVPARAWPAAWAPATSSRRCRARSYSLMQFLFIPIWGRLSDRVGRRPVLLWSIAATSVGMALVGLAPRCRC